MRGGVVGGGVEAVAVGIQVAAGGGCSEGIHPHSPPKLSSSTVTVAEVFGVRRVAGAEGH